MLDELGVQRLEELLAPRHTRDAQQLPAVAGERDRRRGAHDVQPAGGLRVVGDVDLDVAHTGLLPGELAELDRGLAAQRPAAEIDPAILDVLRLACHQLLSMRTAQHAAGARWDEWLRTIPAGKYQRQILAENCGP